MTLYQWREDDMLDLQRMPGTTRPPMQPSAPYIIHTIDHPFCIDPACSCHEQKEEVERVNAWVQQGLMTPQEATQYILGRTF